MDEEEFAKTMHSLISNLSTDGDNSKLLLDGLKEWGRHLAPDRSADRAAGETPVTVQVVHNIPRPVHESPAQDPAADNVESAGE